MKLFYVCPRTAIDCVFHELHGIQLENGDMLVVIKWQDDAEEERFISQPGVLPFPHPAFETYQALSKELVSKLSQFGTKDGDTVLDFSRTVGKDFPQFRLRAHGCIHNHPE